MAAYVGPRVLGAYGHGFEKQGGDAIVRKQLEMRPRRGFARVEPNGGAGLGLYGKNGDMQNDSS
jgi:hypothetical protein